MAGQAAPTEAVEPPSNLDHSDQGTQETPEQRQAKQQAALQDSLKLLAGPSDEKR